MVTKEQALSANMFHIQVGPNKCAKWRRNGKTQTWKTRPDEFRVPIKFGLYDYGAIYEWNALCFHTEEDCPNA